MRLSLASTEYKIQEKKMLMVRLKFCCCPCLREIKLIPTLQGLQVSPKIHFSLKSFKRITHTTYLWMHLNIYKEIMFSTLTIIYFRVVTVLENEVYSLIEQINSNCERLEIMVNKEPPSRKQNAKLWVQVLPYFLRTHKLYQ